ncbi:MAG: hypothetical protein ACOYN0_03520 [Phycisphaerales bacterium]
MRKEAALRSPSKLWNVWLLACAAALAAASAVGGPAFAQCIPAEVVERISLTAEDEQKLAECVAANSAHLGDSKPELVRADRTALLQPLENKKASASFRVKYAKALLPVITPLAGNSNDIVACNALIIAGDLATDSAADLVKRHTDGPVSSVRYQAAYAARRTFETMTVGSPAITPTKGSELLTVIEGRLGSETDALVVDALIRAALEAAKVDELRNQAISTVSKGVQRLVAAGVGGEGIPQAMLESCVVACTGVRAIIALPNVSVSREATLAAGGLGGDLLSGVSVAVSRQRLTLTGNDPAREVHAQAALAGETLVLLVAKKLDASFAAGPKEAGKSLREGTTEGDAKFLVGAADIIGPRGILLQKPFDFAANRFPTK